MKCKKNLRNKYLLLRVCLVLTLLFPGFAFAQNNIQVSGLVTDTHGEAVIGASVAVKGTQTGVFTDIDGKYTISTPDNGTLVFSFMGMKAQTISVNGKKTIDIILEDVVQSLDEVVVVGYGTMKKKDLTTSVVGVSSKEFAERPIVSTAQALQGKAAGVQVVQPSGKPGVGISVRVRGTSSINAGNEPLYVVDGIPTTDISNLSPNDIQDMQILKDASSAAIYGARAANGVVLITTKQGQKGQAKISLSVYGGFSNIGKKIKTLNTQQFYDLMDEMGTAVDRNNTTYTDWNKEVFKTGSQQNYQLGISGGNESSNYYVSLGYQSEKGIVDPAKFERYSVRTNYS